MRNIGNTPDGSFIVEMTRAEVTAFERLAMTIEGKTAWEASNEWGRSALGDDLSTAIECVNSFAALVGTLNEVKQQVSAALVELTKREREKP
jgi:hypothetical protein